MIIETFESGPVATNAYLVADKAAGKALFIDAPAGRMAAGMKYDSATGLLFVAGLLFALNLAHFV